MKAKVNSSHPASRERTDSPESGSTNPRIIRRPEVSLLTGLGRSALYQRVADGDFPYPIKIGRRAVGWIESEVVLWIHAQIEARDSIEPTP